LPEICDIITIIKSFRIEERKRGEKRKKKLKQGRKRGEKREKKWKKGYTESFRVPRAFAS
jgi:hypothetical protein